MRGAAWLLESGDAASMLTPDSIEPADCRLYESWYAISSSVNFRRAAASARAAAGRCCLSWSSRYVPASPVLGITGIAKLQAPAGAAVTIRDSLRTLTAARPAAWAVSHRQSWLTGGIGALESCWAFRRTWYRLPSCSRSRPWEVLIIVQRAGVRDVTAKFEVQVGAVQ